MNFLEEARKRIIFAADVGSAGELRNYIQTFDGFIGTVKLGKELLTYALMTGEPVVEAVMRESSLQVMWDLKYADVPPTVRGAAREVATYYGERILGFTVHCMAGPKALEAALEGVKIGYSGAADKKPMVIAVTLLTSLDKSDLEKLRIQGTPEEVVLAYAKMASDVGVEAIVCSPRETEKVLAINKNFKVINPGIRFSDSSVGEQKRVGTPGGAIYDGAHAVVMGTDLRVGDPKANAERAAKEIAEALKYRESCVTYDEGGEG